MNTKFRGFSDQIKLSKIDVLKITQMIIKMIRARDTMNYRSQPRDENIIIYEFTLL
jgi:hypothetical protein